MNPAFTLIAAIIAEVFGTTCLKLSDGFSNLLPSLGVVVGYAVSFFLLAIVLKEVDVGVAYAVWAGLGITLVAVIGVILFREQMSLLRVGWIALIIFGVIGLELTGHVR
ncbi:MAG: DMT family transporter [Methanomicrobiales archaeon]